MDGNKFQQSQVGPSGDYSNDYEIAYANIVGIRIDQGVDGVVATGSDNFDAASATFLPEHLGYWIVIWDAGNPGNNVAAEISAVISTTQVTVLGATFVTETGLNWALHKKPSLEADMAFIRTALAQTRHPTRAWNDLSPRKSILRSLAFVAAETTLLLSDALSYTVDTTDNGLYLDVYFNGSLWTPDDGVTPVDYKEFSSTQIVPHHNINIGDVLTFVVHGG